MTPPWTRYWPLKGPNLDQIITSQHVCMYVCMYIYTHVCDRPRQRDCAMKDAAKTHFVVLLNTSKHLGVEVQCWYAPQTRAIWDRRMSPANRNQMTSKICSKSGRTWSWSWNHSGFNLCEFQSLGSWIWNAIWTSKAQATSEGSVQMQINERIQHS